ncbi:unnamed protein product [Sphagnum jensenii]|uniref:3'-5' exonuclease domain-containing protein n=1 Tax=Sphagnum jensenii TaxID=128206 RepID=A0ABP0VCQ2_9BRYO
MLELDSLLQPLFLDRKVIKVGQGLYQDFKELKASFPSMKAFRHCNSIIETNALHQYLNKEITYNVSLKNFTRNYLHFDLDKSCQLSAWGRRPLTEAQRQYAACDALVLLRLYDVMMWEASCCPDFSLSRLLRTARDKPKAHRSSALLVSQVVASLVKGDEVGRPTHVISNQGNTDFAARELQCDDGRHHGSGSSIQVSTDNVAIEDQFGSPPSRDKDNSDDPVPVYRKFYSFAERHWFSSEQSRVTKSYQSTCKSATSPTLSAGVKAGNTVTEEPRILLPQAAGKRIRLSN